MNRRVEGSYVRVEDAIHAVQRLREEGYSKKDIYVVANSTVRDSIPYTMDAEVSTDSDMRSQDHDSDRSLWDKIKDAFTMDEYDTPNQSGYDANNDPLSGYHDEIEQGNVIVLVDEGARTSVTDDTTSTSTTTDAGVLGGGMGAFGPSAPLDPVMGDDGVTGDKTFTDVPGTDSSLTDHHHHNTGKDDETIELKEERLDVDKNEVQTGEVKIGKHVVEETKNIEVPVTHEEVTIERRPVTDRHSTTEPIRDTNESEEIVVPITEEQIDVSKHTDVVEEVDIRKDKVTENKHVTDTVRKEELDIDKDGHVDVEDHTDGLTSDDHTDNDLNHPL